MSEELDIFSIGDAPSGKFFYFKEVGDSIKGTYVDVSEGKDSYGNDQYIYALKDAEGNIWKIGVRKTAAILIEEMNEKSFGDIIGLRYDENKESKRYPGKFAKIIRVYPHRTKGPVDEAWLAERARIEAALGHQVAPKAAPSVPQESPVTPHVAQPVGEVRPVSTGVVKTDVDPTPVEQPVNEAVVAIRNLAKTKGLVTDGMTPEESDLAITGFTGFPLTEENYSKIIIKITSYTK